MQWMITPAAKAQGSYEFQLSDCGMYRALDKNISASRPHGREDWHIILVEHGCLKAELAGKACIARDGDIVYYPPHAPHRYTYEAGAETCYYWVHFYGSGAAQMMADFGFREAVQHLHDVMEIVAAFQSLLKMPLTAPGAQYMQRGQLQLLLAKIGQHLHAAVPTRHAVRIAEIAAGMRATPEELCSNAALAAACGISEYHFIRLFKAQTGYTPHKYRMTALLEKAKGLLQDTDLQIGEIAYLLHLSDPLYFSRLFKTAYGISPDRYRRMASDMPSAQGGHPW